MIFTATDIVQWASTRQAQAHLPELVMRLVLAADTPVTHIEMRSGDSIYMPGFDGTVEAGAQSTFVPSGRSVWEMGVTASPGAKAESDYQKRSKSTDSKHAQTTYVAVSARRWDAKGEWADSHRSEGPWAGVRAYDADDLYNWLTQAPTVATWFGALIGRPSAGLETLDGFWDRWCSATEPALTTELVVDARGMNPDQLVDMFTAGPSSLVVRAETIDDAVAYIAGLVMKLGDKERAAMLARSLLVRDQAAWDVAGLSDTPLVLIPTFDDAFDAGAAVRRGHTVIVPRGPELAPNGSNFELPSLRVDLAHDALKAMGVESDRAWRLARSARCSFASVRRTFARDAVTRDPAWASGSDARTVLIAALLGSWASDRAADQEIVEALSGSSYAEFEQRVRRLAHVSDAPVRLTSGIWLIADKDDAWRLVSRWLEPTDLDRLADAACKVIAEFDPALTIARDERWMAGIYGHQRRYSDHLRHGLADTLCLLGATPDDAAHQARVSTIVTDLLTATNADASGMLWVSMSEDLPRLAEAAPDAFLTAVESGLAGSTPVLSSIFQDGGNGPSIGIGAPHTGLCRALELLAWSRDYIARAAHALHELARIDPGGRYDNRPDRSLHMILNPIHPQTQATPDERIALLEREARPSPSTEILRVLRSLLPSPGHATVHSSCAPERRDWKTPNIAATFEDVRLSADRLVALLLEIAPNDLETIKLLARRVTYMPPQSSDAVLARLEQDDMDDELRATAKDELRSVLTSAKHPKSHITTDRYERVLRVHDQLTPTDTVWQHAWLFGDRPDIDLFDLSNDDLADQDRFHATWQQRSEELARRRSEAAGRILDGAGVDGLRRLGAIAQQQRHWEFGSSVADHPTSTEQELWIADCLRSTERDTQRIAHGWIHKHFHQNGWEWLTSYLDSIDPSLVAQALYSIPLTDEVIEYVDRDAALTMDYWNGLPDPGRIVESKSIATAAERLIAMRRFYAAIGLIHINVAYTENSVPSDLIARSLEGVLHEDTAHNHDRGSFPRHVSDLLNILEADTSFERSRLASIEWTLIAVTDLSYPPRPPRHLHQEIANSPAFFAELVQLTMPEGEVTADDQARAANASRLLHAWKTLPGSNGTNIDPIQLAAWIDEVRDLLAGNERQSMAALHTLGEAFAHWPELPDHPWPHPAIADAIDRLQNEWLEDGFRYEITNSRGITSRGVLDGGDQERTLAATWAQRADSLVITHPRTARLLRDVADSYLREGAMHDSRADARQDLPWA